MTFVFLIPRFICLHHFNNDGNICTASAQVCLSALFVSVYHDGGIVQRVRRGKDVLVSMIFFINYLTEEINPAYLHARAWENTIQVD